MRAWGPAAALAIAACANIEPPPGAPPDQAPPTLVAVIPESLAILPGFDDDAVFQFGEVISEGSTPNQGTGSGDLERLVLLSPSDRVPHVSWKRNRIAVKPAEGWQPGRVYRIELLPGVTDLRRNRSDATAVITFSTGASLPTDTLRGQVINWTSSTPANGALVVATLLPDSLSYRTLADSAGRFALGPLPRGTYFFRAVIDQNTNRRADPREDFDSTSVGPGALEVPSLWTFPHDTLGPRITGITVHDSLSATVQFNQYLDPRQRLDATGFELLLLPDSTPVRALTLLPRAEHDSLYRPLPTPDSAAVDSTPGDSAAQPVRPTPPEVQVTPADSARRALLGQRPALFNRLTLRSAEAWRIEGRYVLKVTGIRNVNGAASDPAAGFVIPTPRSVPPPDSLAADSLARDSLSGDSVPPPPPRDSL